MDFYANIKINNKSRPFKRMKVHYKYNFTTMRLRTGTRINQEAAMYLITNDPQAFILFTIIYMHLKATSNSVDSLEAQTVTVKRSDLLAVVHKNYIKQKLEFLVDNSFIVVKPSITGHKTFVVNPEMANKLTTEQGQEFLDKYFYELFPVKEGQVF